MNKTLFFITASLSCLVMACSPKMANSAGANYTVEEENVANTLQFLTSDELAGRDSGSEGIEKAAQYLEDIFSKNSVKPYFTTYRDTLSNYPKPAYNIVGYLEGSDHELKKEFVIIGAHYDHVGIGTAVSNDSIYNGADDNASGTTAVAELVNYFAKAKNNKRSIMFCFFSAEEKGLLGSKHLAKKLKGADFNLYVMLNFEMIGVPMNKEYEAYITGPGRSNMMDKLNEYAGERLIGSNEFEMKYQLFRASDNYPFFTEFNVPAHTLSTTDMEVFQFYHKPGDEFEAMDTKHMTAFIQQIIPVADKMVNAPSQDIVVKTK